MQKKNLNLIKILIQCKNIKMKLNNLLRIQIYFEKIFPCFKQFTVSSVYSKCINECKFHKSIKQ